jgi:hypothetical protein
MAKRYGHIGQKALRTAVETISSAAQPAPSTPAKNAEIPAGSFANPLDLNCEDEGNVPKV